MFRITMQRAIPFASSFSNATHKTFIDLIQLPLFLKKTHHTYGLRRR